MAWNDMHYKNELSTRGANYPECDNIIVTSSTSDMNLN